jgi:hypothetical protein
MLQNRIFGLFGKLLRRRYSHLECEGWVWLPTHPKPFYFGNVNTNLCWVKRFYLTQNCEARNRFASFCQIVYWHELDGAFRHGHYIKQCLNFYVNVL